MDEFTKHLLLNQMNNKGNTDAVQLQLAYYATLHSITVFCVLMVVLYMVYTGKPNTPTLHNRSKREGYGNYVPHRLPRLPTLDYAGFDSLSPY